MIIRIKGANYTYNIGALDTYFVKVDWMGGLTPTGTSVVKKNAKYEQTFTIKEGWFLQKQELKIEMGDTDITSNSGVVTISGKTVTIVIGEVTGNVHIRIPTAAELNLAGVTWTGDENMQANSTIAWPFEYRHMDGYTEVDEGEWADIKFVDANGVEYIGMLWESFVPDRDESSFDYLIYKNASGREVDAFAIEYPTTSENEYSWYDESYRTITFKGGNDLTILSPWFKEYGVLSGEEDEPDAPSSTTWYTGYDVLDSSVAKDASAPSYGGFAYSNETILSKLRNKPINIIKASFSTTGTFTVGIVNSSNTIVDSVVVNVTNTGVQEIELGKTLTASSDQRLFVQAPSDTATFLYEMTNSIPDFPIGMDAYVGVKQIQSFPKYNMNINFGYMTSTTPSNPSNAWYTGYEVLSSCTDESSASYGGFAYSNETILSKLRNVPVNAIKANFNKTGTFTVGIVNSSNEIIDSVTVNVASAGVQVVKLGKTMTAGDGQRFFANKPGDTATFLYEITNSIEGFPEGMDAYVGVKTLQNFPKYNMNINFGYVN